MDEKDSNTITINLDDTYGATTTYLGGSGGGYLVSSDLSAFNSDTITLNDTFTVTNVGAYGSGGGGLDAVGIGTIQISGGGGAGSSFTFTEPQWSVATPGTHIEISEVESMCKEYPALAKVYENFKTVYDLVLQDWKGKKDAENS
jgi:hypothetical protein